MIRRSAKTLLCGAITATGVDRVIGRAAGQPWIIGYHRVVEDQHVEPLMPGLYVSRRTFEAELDWLACNFEVTGLERVASVLAGGERSRRPLAAITFDDGYRDNYEIALPLLLRKGLPATFFLITDLVDGALPPLHDRLFHGLRRMLEADGESDSATCAYVVTRVLLHSASTSLLERLCDELQQVACGEPLTWEMVRRMRAAGMDIGSHGATHRLLTRVPLGIATAELSRSKDTLERELGEPVRLFAYPDGDFNRQVVAAVDAAGYDLAVTTCYHRDARHPQLTLPRTILSEGATTGPLGMFSKTVMRCHANGVIRLWRPSPKDHGLYAQKVARWL